MPPQLKPVVKAPMTREEFLDLVCDAYREFKGLPGDSDIRVTYGEYKSGTVQVTLKLPE